MEISLVIRDIQEIISQARDKAVRSVNFERVLMYWQIGKRVFEEEQLGKERAEYGSNLIKNLALALEPEFGSAFSERQLERFRQFFRNFQKASALRTEFSWTHYKLLISVENEDKRSFYEAEGVKNNWTSRELERQLNSHLYERLLLSNDKASVIAVARKEKLPETASEIIKDPMVLEFLGLKRESSYYEKDLESAIILTEKKNLNMKSLPLEFSSVPTRTMQSLNMPFLRKIKRFWQVNTNFTFLPKKSFWKS